MIWQQAILQCVRDRRGSNQNLNFLRIAAVPVAAYKGLCSVRNYSVLLAPLHWRGLRWPGQCWIRCLLV